ncbi:hypothetical protein BN1723_009497 [Verticillium longisporum]|uniref:AB hydrolase-1 domain-containing protein n=1 Tax=Verticillium longisporum TaxID=100787 RepID=A0A0G4KPU8_VERLO|nr:hypothetical protein BN1723_009497 [Verticillium longisporum]
MSIPTYKLLRRACHHLSISPGRRFATTLANTHCQEFTLPDGRILGFAGYGDPRGQPLLYFHGFPSSRLEASVMDDMARQRKIRLLALDRPGFGRSSTQPGQRILDWPADVAAFATGQNIERFAAIVYPACGGQASCGSVQYADSARQGTAAVATAVNAFNQRCPDSQIILVGYSQGGQIMDNAYCGGGDTSAGITDTSIPISASAQQMIRAAIMMGSPRFVAGQSQNVGDCLAQGFAARPASFQCPFAANIQSYCDAPDPFCCDGNDAVRHQQYGTIYGAEALTFVNGKLA